MVEDKVGINYQTGHSKKLQRTKNDIQIQADAKCKENGYCAKTKPSNWQHSFPVQTAGYEEGAARGGKAAGTSGGTRPAGVGPCNLGE